jgi:hypothetical protein
MAVTVAAPEDSESHADCEVQAEGSESARGQHSLPRRLRTEFKVEKWPLFGGPLWQVGCLRWSHIRVVVVFRDVWWFELALLRHLKL